MKTKIQITITETNSFNLIKDSFYRTALSNLIKKTKFLQLYIELIENQITEKEYEHEISKNEKEYLIQMGGIDSTAHFMALHSIIQTLEDKNKLSVDDISEIFGIDTQSLKTQLECPKV